MVDVPDEVMSNKVLPLCSRFILNNIRELVSTDTFKKIKLFFTKGNNEEYDYSQFITELEKTVDKETFYNIMRELSKVDNNYRAIYTKYMHDTITPLQYEWYETYSLSLNPFDYVSGINTWELFVGYGDEVKEVENTILHSYGREGIVNIYGPPFIGKTSMMTYLMHSFSEANVVSCHVERPASSPTDLLQNILSELVSVQKTNRYGLKTKIGAWISGELYSQISSNLLKERPSAISLYKQITKISKDNPNTCFVIIIDEANIISGNALSYFYKLLNINNFNFIITQKNRTYKEEEIDTMIGKRIPLGGLSLNDTEKLIERYLRTVRLSEEEWNNPLMPFEEETIALIYKYCIVEGKRDRKANPGLIVKLCHECMNNASIVQTLIDGAIVKETAKNLNLKLQGDLSSFMD